MNWTEWTELSKLDGGSFPPCPEMNWRNCQSTRSDRRTERTFLRRFWTEFASLWHHTTSRTSKQAQPASTAFPPPRRQTPGRRAKISSGADLEFFLCSSQTIGGSMDWTELNWTEALGPHVTNWTERTFQTSWWLGNWTVLNWCQTILNFNEKTS